MRPSTKLRLFISAIALAGGLMVPARQALATEWTAPPPGTTVQGWTEQNRADWYTLDQGSRLMPLTWFKALEQPDAAGQPFLDNAYLATFRVLPPGPDTPGGLPIGFTRDFSDDTHYIKTKLRWLPNQQSREPWVGLNCAACHTSELSYRGHLLAVEGAPGLFDYQSFVNSVDASLKATRDSAAPGADNSRWNRFASKILGNQQDQPANRARLLTALNQLITFQDQTAALNQTGLVYGFGRVDAVGHILNRILLFGGARQPFPNASDAPVSYPHLWNTNLENHVEWDGIAQNSSFSLGGPAFKYGALGRNTGEVLGVFGEAVIKPPANKLDLSGFISSVNITNLNYFEWEIAKLKPPVWPTNLFGTPGDIGLTGTAGRKLPPQAVVKAGGALFATDCAMCHVSPPYTAHTPYHETLWTFQQMGPENLTDIWMACNTWANKGNSGALNGIPADYVTGAPLKPYDFVNAMLVTTVKGVLIADKFTAAGIAVETFFGITPPPERTPLHAVNASLKDQRRQLCMANAGDPLLAYKARPLEGIWATPPYLHNGSVPTLYDLLLPPAQRPKSFYLGTRIYDPVKAGYETGKTASGNGFLFNTQAADGTPLDGNSNAGHVYGVDKLSKTQRLELLEYLKTL